MFRILFDIPPVFVLGLFLVYPYEHGVAASGDSDFRLFTTANQRHALDETRRVGPPPDETNGKTPIIPEQPKPLPQVSIRGFVQRNNSLNTVWTDKGSTLHPHLLDPDININAKKIHDTKVSVTVGGETIKLKPGQYYARSNNRIRESIENAPDNLIPSLTPLPANQSRPTTLPLGPEAASSLIDKATRTKVSPGSQP